jgi:hypothetical protein
LTVYVDDMYLDSMGQFGRMKMSHMLADTDDELHAMAARIGVARRWWQDPAKRGISTSHYDVCLTKRELAIRCGAVAITDRQAACMSARRKVTGALGSPTDAIEWRRGTRAARQGGDAMRCAADSSEASTHSDFPAPALREGTQGSLW